MTKLENEQSESVPDNLSLTSADFQATPRQSPHSPVLGGEDLKKEALDLPKMQGFNESKTQDSVPESNFL